MQILLSHFKCRKSRKNWKELRNIAEIESNGKIYKSNTVTVFNKKCKSKCKEKIIYYGENCNCKYRIKVKKCLIDFKESYKVSITIYNKRSRQIKKIKFVI